MTSEPLDSPEALSRHLAALLAVDPRLAPIAARVGDFQIRRTDAGFPGLARVICGQQLSVASASAIWGRFAALPGALVPETCLQLTEAEVRAVGFSRGKYVTVRAVAEATVAGTLHFESLHDLPAEDAVAALTRIKGVGPWTAEIYLMFCAGHPDIFPAGDLALQKAVAAALGLGERVNTKDLVEMAKLWAPHRATAALLFWRYYAAMRQRQGVPL
jgi:DNA-3-methyladenine glycosylase II